MSEIKFSERQIQKLRDGYGKIEKINPTGAVWTSFEAFVKKLPVEALRQLEQADIKWVSGLARLNLVSRGL